MAAFDNPAMVAWIAAWAIAALVAAWGLLRRDGRPPIAARPEEGAPEARPSGDPVPERSRRAGEADDATPGDRFRRGLARTSSALAERIRGALGRDRDFEALLEGIEEGLIQSDVGVRTSQDLLDALRRLPSSGRTESGIRDALRREVLTLLRPSGAPEGDPEVRGPRVFLVVGVNGVGKTTTIGKLAAHFREMGNSVLLVAGDTFRAAAIDQLSVWADRTGAEIVRQAPGADPSAVVFDGIGAAVARGVDVVLVDTAGRLHTKVNLMEELKKVRRTVERQFPGAPHEVLLVLDATTGQNAISQARNFSEAVAVTGVVLTKLDGSARGGMAVAVGRELGLPIRFVGLGETARDLQPFDPEAFAEALLPSE